MNNNLYLLSSKVGAGWEFSMVHFGFEVVMQSLGDLTEERAKLQVEFGA